MSKKKMLIPVIVFTVLIVIIIIALNPSHKYNKLIVSESKWNSIINSRTENEKLTIDSIEFNDYKLIIDEKNSILYYSVVNDSQNKYNPIVSYSSNNKNTKLVVLSHEITDDKVKNNYQFKIMIYNEKEYHIYNLQCTNLPILNISYNQDQKISQKNIPMEIYLFDNLSNIPNKITVSSGKIKLNEGEFIFSLHMLTPGKNKRDNKISILNMKPNSEFILTEVTKTSDNIQEQTSDINMENKKNRVELFLNNEYKGIYNLEYSKR